MKYVETYGLSLRYVTVYLYSVRGLLSEQERISLTLKKKLKVIATRIASPTILHQSFVGGL